MFCMLYFVNGPSIGLPITIQRFIDNKRWSCVCFVHWTLHSNNKRTRDCVLLLLSCRSPPCGYIMGSNHYLQYLFCTKTENFIYFVYSIVKSPIKPIICTNFLLMEAHRKLGTWKTVATVNKVAVILAIFP